MVKNHPIALITGGSRGIGAAIARELAPTHRLIIGGRTAESVATVTALYEDATGFIADLADPVTIENAVSALEIDRLDVLVHSAGLLGSSKPVAETSLAEWQQVMGVNVIAVAQLTRLLLPALRNAGGQVIMINSGSGLKASAGTSVYSSSKFALRALADSLREEERGRIRVTSIHSGRVATDMQVQLQANAGRAYVASDHLQPESVAAAVRLAVDASAEAMVETISVRPIVTMVSGKSLK
ncbi:MAG: SDR family oxidoreductase [Actinomycetaceae bacterium]|nr:SDR family oxidoreductase [Actinomycetaceae bacterium]